MPKIAIIAALEREVKPLVSGTGWNRSVAVRAAYGCYEHESALVVCAGIGAATARKAAEDVVCAVRPTLLVSAGLAGALVPEWKVAQVMLPESVICSSSGAVDHTSFLPALSGLRRQGVLVSASGIPGPEGKRLLAGHYRGHAVDMEAASVAGVARNHGIPFVAIKAISDEYDFPMPDLEPFVDEQGRFKTGSFVLHAMLRPSLWPVMSRLASNSTRASQELCLILRTLLKSRSRHGDQMSTTPADSITQLEQTSR